MGPVAHWDRRRRQHWSCQRCFQFCFIVQIRDKAIFLYKNFSTNQNSRKNKFNYSTSLPLESKDEWTVMLKKFYWPLLYLRNSGEKIFRPIRIWEKIKFNYGTCCSLRSTEERTLILRTSFSHLFYRPNPWQSDFLYKNFSTNQNWRKNQIELWDLLLIGIHGGANTNPAKVVFTFVLSSKSVTKRFFV